jgi:hypothetical protein
VHGTTIVGLKNGRRTIGVTVPLMKRIFEYSRSTKDGTGVLSFIISKEYGRIFGIKRERKICHIFSNIQNFWQNRKL